MTSPGYQYRPSHHRLAFQGCLVLVSCVALFLRTQRLSDVAVWFDEAFCLRMIELPFGEIWERAARDAHPPLYFWTLKCWTMLFGASVVAARLLSVGCGCLSVVATYLLLIEFNRTEDSLNKGESSCSWSPILATVFVALSPTQVSWSMQVRMYSLGTLLAITSSWLLLRALRRPANQMVWWGWYTLTAMAMAYTHYCLLFTMAAQWLFAAGYIFSRGGHAGWRTMLDNALPLLLSACVVSLAWQPWLPDFLAQRSRVIASFWSGPFDWETVGRAFHQTLLWPRWGRVSPQLGLVLLEASFVLLMILLLGQRPSDVYVALVAGLPVVAVLAHSHWSRNIIDARYLVFAQPFLLIAIAKLLVRIPQRAIRFGSVAIVVLGSLVIAATHYRHREEKAMLPGLRAAIHGFEQAASPGDLLLVSNPMLYQCTLTYTADRNRVATLSRAQGREFPFYFGTAVLDPDDYQSWDDATAAKRQWVWTLNNRRTGRVSVDTGWTLVREAAYREYYGDLELRLYQSAP